MGIAVLGGGSWSLPVVWWGEEGKNEWVNDKQQGKVMTMDVLPCLWEAGTIN